MEVYKEERRIYNEQTKGKNKIASIVEEKAEEKREIAKEPKPDANHDTTAQPAEETKVQEIEEVEKQPAEEVQAEPAQQDSAEPKVQEESVAIVEVESHPKTGGQGVPKTEFCKLIDSLKVKRNISTRIGLTMSDIMFLYAAKRDIQKATRFQEEAFKYILEGVKNNKDHLQVSIYYGNSGDMYLKFEGNKNKDIGYEHYEKANQILEKILGSKSIDFIYSTADIGDVYLERKQYKEAEAFYTYCKSQIEEFYGKNSIFKHRINSALVEVYSAIGEGKTKGYDCAMENVDLGMRLYGDESIFCLGFYMSGMSANVQKGTHSVGEHILSKMLKVLESENQLAYGNQYFFLASILLGIVWYSSGKYDQAHLFFTGTMKKQLVYVEGEQDHPFLEQTYMHMAVMYKAINNINSSMIMWRSLLKIHQRVYGENSYLLSADYKNIGIWELGLGQVENAIETLHTSETLSRAAIESLNEEDDIRDEKKQLSEVYFSLYLSYVANNEWDKALSANEASLKLNIELLGENDLNVSNNYYLGAQIYFKKLWIDEALNYANKANQIIDTKPSKEPLLLARYKFLRAKLYKLMDKNKEALCDLDEAIRVAENNPQLYNDENEIKSFRRNLIACLTEEEKQKFGIDSAVEEVRDQQDLTRKKEVENQMKKSYIEQTLKNQGIDPSKVNTNDLIDEEEEKEESFLESPVGAISVIGGLIAVCAGAIYLWKKK